MVTERRISFGGARRLWPLLRLLAVTAGVQLAAAPEPKPAAAPALRISGAVQHAMDLSLTEVRALPVVAASWEWEEQKHSAKGADLFGLINRAGLKENPAVKNHFLRFAVVARGRDGYEAVFSVAELMPNLGGAKALVAYEQDGGALPERNSPLKLVAASDQGPSRWVRDLIELRVVDLNSTGLPNAPNHLAP